MNPNVFYTVFPLWLRAFALTLLIEIPLYVALDSYFRKIKSSKTYLRAVLAATLGTFTTHPLLWFVWPYVITNYILYVITGEILAVLIEALCLFAIARPVSLKHAAIISLVANAVSFGVGTVIQSIWGMFSH